MRPHHQREFIRRDGKCPLCEEPLGAAPAFAHETAGRVHTMCALDARKWKRWMEKVGLIPTEVAVEVVEDGKAD